MAAHTSNEQRNSKQSKLHAVFGPPPIFDGEDAADYDALLERVSSAVKPIDMIEEILVRSVVDLTWIQFSRRRVCASLNFNDGYAGELGKMERIDRLAMTAEVRLISFLREIDRHRSWVALKSQSTFEEIQDAKFETVKPKAIAPKKRNP